MFFLSSCNAQIKKPKTPKIQKVKAELALPAGDYNSNLKYKKKVNWYKDGYVNKTSYYDFKYAKSISKVKKNYQIINGLLSYKGKLVDSTEIYYRDRDSIDYIVWIRNGLPIKEIVNIDGHPKPSLYSVIYHDKNVSYYFPEGDSYIKNGNGNLKRFYYGKWEFVNNHKGYVKNNIKEEGEIKSNFKYGEWKYYNRQGSIDSTKTYFLKDSVDVRFPHCIFNKKEPCFCNEI